MKSYSILEDYLDGNLNSFEKRNLETAIEDDDRWKQEYKLRKETNEAIKEEDIIQFRDQVNNMLAENPVTQYSAPANTLKRSMIKKVVAAASFIFIIGIGSMTLYINNQAIDNQSIYDKYYEPYEATITFRSADTEINNLLTKALEQYKAQNYSEALTLFKTVLDKKEDIAASLYSGISYMEIEKFKKANQSFKEVIDDGQNLFVEQAKWYMSMCYLKMDKSNKASSLLRELACESTFYKKDARNILRKIE